MDPLTSSVQIGGLNALSAYSHLIIVCSVFAFSVFSAYVGRGFFYLFWVAVVSGLRLFVQWVLGDLQSAAAASTYSTYILCFTMMYLATPGAVVGGNVVNYPMMMFFLAYIIGDIYARSKHVYGSVIPYTALGASILGGAGAGMGISALVYASPMKDWLFVVDPNATGETCSRPSQQQFKCSVYRNGSLVSEH